MWTNDTAASGGGYAASASIATAAAPAPPGATPTPAPSPAPQPGATPAPSQPGPAPSQPATTITLKTKSASAKRSKKRLVLAVSSSGPVTKVVGSLTRGKKKFATGKLAKLSGSGKIKLKVTKRLKPGKYVVGLYGKDAKGATVGGTTPIKIKK